MKYNLTANDLVMAHTVDFTQLDQLVVKTEIAKKLTTDGMYKIVCSLQHRILEVRSSDHLYCHAYSAHLPCTTTEFTL